MNVGIFLVGWRTPSSITAVPAPEKCDQSGSGYEYVKEVAAL